MPISFHFNFLSISFQFPCNSLTSSFQFPFNFLSNSFQVPFNLLSRSFQVPCSRGGVLASWSGLCRPRRRTMRGCRVTLLLVCRCPPSGKNVQKNFLHQAKRFKKISCANKSVKKISSPGHWRAKVIKKNSSPYFSCQKNFLKTVKKISSVIKKISSSRFLLFRYAF